jgi:hypothetical protein
MVVSPVRRREEPLACVREEVFREMGRVSVGRREEGRRGGVWVRWAWRRAGGEISGMAEAGMVVKLFVGGESDDILWFVSSIDIGDYSEL